MDGATLTRELTGLLGESSGSSYLDSKSTYDYLYEAAVVTVQRTDCLTGTQTITTVAEQRDYYLDADFMKLYLTDSQNRMFIKYNNGSADSFIYPITYDSIILGDNDTSQSIPSSFTVRDATPIATVSSTVTSDGAASGGVCTLTDTASNFTTLKVSVGDFVNNVSDVSHGVVVAITSATALVTALFAGSNNDWTSGDSYHIHPQGRFYLTLDPPPSTSSHTITVYYVKKPAPVYSSYYSYKLPMSYKSALVQYAAWLYKYRDREPNYGDAWFKYWDLNVRRIGREMNAARMTKSFRVNFIKRATNWGSYK